MNNVTETRCIRLQGKDVIYTFKRTKRKSIGLKIKDGGLIVSAPLGESLQWIESVLNTKSNWLIKNLAQREKRQSTQLVWETASVFPLLGQPWQLTMVEPDTLQMAPAKSPIENESIKSLALTAHQIEKLVMSWYYQQAIRCFNARVSVYANKLDISLPSLRLSRATTRWGSCNSRGIIHLNWRLVQMPIHLVDYVVAHELSHLIEMNHSPAFWRVVARIYPDYVAARMELKKFGC